VIIFERTQDWELVKLIVTHPKIWKHVVDDRKVQPEEWEPVKDESVWFVLAKDDGQILGMWMFTPENLVTWKVHTCVLPWAYGAKAKEAAEKLSVWFFAQTGAERLITEVPQYNRLALKFAKCAGMVQYGLNPKSYLKFGKLQDLILLGMSKPEVDICH
jgi:RimJ/RimL family protein N-acetyltransferase